MRPIRYCRSRAFHNAFISGKLEGLLPLLPGYLCAATHVGKSVCVMAFACVPTSRGRKHPSYVHDPIRISQTILCSLRMHLEVRF